VRALTGDACTIAAMICRATSLLLLVLAVGTPACSREKPSPPVPLDAQAGTTAREFSAGDAVVVETARATFVEGVVLRTGKSRMTIETAGESKEVDPGNVYALPNEPAALPEGAFAICRFGEHKWLGCRIERRDSGRVSVVSEDGEKIDLEATALLKPSSMTELNLRQGFDQAAKRRAFVDGAKEAGRPVVPKGWSVRPGDRVLVQTSEGYRSAKVQRVRKGQVIVQVDGEGKDVRGVTKAEVFPQPPQAFNASSSSYACLRPPTGEPVWPIVKIEGSADQKVTVSDASGRKWVVEASELTPLVK